MVDTKPSVEVLSRHMRLVLILPASPTLSLMEVLSQPMKYGEADPEALYAIDKDGSRLAWEGMKAHASQLVWYRRLFIVFSRYVHINIFRAIN